ncbi:polyprenyl synthetase family protein [Vulcanisaeta sp. JCM 16161]|uniref:polyprenyl synthetase family protein n=1 Tax=Vulcanisaeta sp. JCM 16161 TaxID=1295372 RepID=UPI000A736DE7|nr:polyprenyl synthetase family protein [Vulcanisaeta sp. JCM 16161]
MAVLNPSKYMELLPTEVRSAINKVIQVLEESFLGLWMPNNLLNATYHYIRNRGKLIRPTLVLLMAYAWVMAVAGEGDISCRIGRVDTHGITIAG